MTWDILAAEVQNDPLKIGYDAMTDLQVADSLNAPIQEDQPVVSSGDLISGIVRAEYDALLAENKDWLKIILGAGEQISVASGSEVRSELMRMFGAASETRTNLMPLLSRDTTRAEQIGLDPNVWGPVTEEQVAKSRSRTLSKAMK
ncbi:MAG: hypothetical protein QNJ62_06490 [Methyloceanibacter sp.]|nr:hypothetical protein [Methyloceanibacter sp.]